MKIDRIPLYRQGAEGFFLWVEDNVYLEIPDPKTKLKVWTPVKKMPVEPNPVTGRSFRDIWENQKRELREALRMDDNGNFIYRLIVLCWCRGEGKSAAVCLMKLWKFFCFPRQLIVLGANSKDQSQFVHFDIMRDIILNSPPLLNVIGRKNILNNMIIMRKGDEIFSSVRTISSFSGIVSNITGYTFSEMFDMKNPKFFVQLDGSTRNIPNAMGMIDSTVASKDHILYSLFESFINQTDPYIYFSFRSSPNADSRDYWHPEMTQKQLNSYKTRFPPDEFDRYFKNVWELTGNRLFSVDMIDASNYIGLDGEFNTSSSLILSLCKQRVTALSEIRRLEIESLKRRKGSYIKRKRKTSPGIAKKLQLIKKIDSRLISIDDELNLGREENRIVTPDGLARLSEIYDTDWVITAGVDRADPESEGRANSIVAFLAKGLEGSASFRYTESSNIDYLYFLIGLILIRDDSLKDIKEWIGYVDDEFSGLDSLCSERWAMWDIKDWCDEREIPLELIFPTYERQRAAFSEVHRSLSIARFKAPTIPIPGAKEHDIFREELSYFDHDSRKKQYKSIEKDPKSKKPILVQDDSMYATGWAFYGGRELTVSDLRPRNQRIFMGHFVPDPSTHSHQMAIRDNPGTVPITRGRR